MFLMANSRQHRRVLSSEEIGEVCRMLDDLSGKLRNDREAIYVGPVSESPASLVLTAIVGHELLSVMCDTVGPTAVIIDRTSGSQPTDMMRLPRTVLRKSGRDEEFTEALHSTVHAARERLVRHRIREHHSQTPAMILGAD